MNLFPHQMLNDLWSDLETIGDLNANHFNMLHGLFGDKFFSILPALTPESVKKLVTPTGRFLFRVQNLHTSKVDLYDCNYVLILGNRCDCYKVQREISIDLTTWCKHLIAARISLAIKCYETVEMSEEDYNDIFKNIINNR